MQFINNEISRITNILSKNENINILYKSKFSKFGLDKFKNISMLKNKNKKKEKPENIKTSNEEYKITISETWLKNKDLTCKYVSFVTIFYFCISSYITQEIDKKNKDNSLLIELKDLIINLANDVKDDNLNLIIF